MSTQVVSQEKLSLVKAMASRYQMEPAAFFETLKKTIFPGEGKLVTNEQVAAFLVVASQYDLNPFTKEIYAFPGKAGGIQPIVSIDGWLKLINRHPEFDGMELQDHIENGVLVAVTCHMHRKDRQHATVVTEYLSECVKNTDVWKTMPGRMLRHRATIQCARYAFGFAGIQSEDEALAAVEVEPAIRMPQRLSDTNGNGNMKQKPEAVKAAIDVQMPSDCITEKQAGRFYTIAGQAGLDENEAKEFLVSNFGFHSALEIPKALYEQVCDQIEQK